MKPSISKTLIRITVCASLFLTFFTNLLAQDWLPYNHNNICNYSTSNLFSDIATIKTDSFKIQNAEKDSHDHRTYETRDPVHHDRRSSLRISL